MNDLFPSPDDQPANDQPGLFPDMVSEYREGKDELNLAEFPIAALSNRVDQGTKTIVFEDFVFDKAAGCRIKRSLTITASDAYGLPTASDDEVLLGLIQLTRQQGFTSPRVYFTPYRLMQILGWRPTTKNYRRLSDALNRWLGVSLFYDNAWRDRRSNQWVDQKFHFLDNVSMHKPGQKSLDGPQGYSFVKWNDVVFRSFQAGNLKALDFQTFRKLQSAIAKRMYRFLDKRFYQRPRLIFDLEGFAFEKLGLPRSYNDIAQLKRRLMPGILELEEVGFIKKEDAKDRFSKTRVGIWEVIFERFQEETEQTDLAIDIDELSPLEGRLIGHGVSRSQAARIVSEYDSSVIEDQIDALEYLLTKKGATVPENCAGWLVKAISEKYSPPRGYKSKEARAAEEQIKRQKQEIAATRKRAQEEAEKARKEQFQKAYEEEEDKIRAFMEKHTPEERQKIEERALRNSPAGKGRISASMREVVIHDFVLGLIAENNKIL